VYHDLELGLEVAIAAWVGLPSIKYPHRTPTWLKINKTRVAYHPGELT
jgi:hypothetical protein